MAKKAKQQHLEGMAPPSIPEIDAAADAFVDARNAFMRAKDKMNERKEICAALMKRHSLQAYEYDGKIAKFEHKDNLKVAAIKKDADE